MQNNFHLTVCSFISFSAVSEALFACLIDASALAVSCACRDNSEPIRRITLM